MAASYVTLVLDRYDGAGNPYVKGGGSLTPSLEFPDPADQMLVGQAPVPFSFRSGSFPQVRLIANDTAGPQGESLPGWTWNIAYNSDTPGGPAPASYYLLSTNGTPQYLSSLASVPAAQPGTTYYPRAGGVPFTGPVAPGDTALIDAPSVTVSAILNDTTLQLTSAVGASRTVTLEEAGLDGQVLTMLLIQPASGGPCGVTWAGSIDWGRAISAPALSGSANANDLLAWKWKAALASGAGAWKYMGIN